MTVSQHNIPRLLPLVAIPVANDDFREKYVLTMATPGTNRQPAPSPTQTACASSTCQYLLLILNIMVPNTIRNEPVKIKGRKKPASKAGPVQTPMKMSRKACTDPIQEILLCDSSRKKLAW